MKEYEKPMVLTHGYSPEPVEAGCCLRSCGGVPGGMQAGRHLKKEAGATLAILEQARFMLTDN